MELRSFKMSVTIYQSKPQRHESAAQGIRIIQSNTSFLKLLRIIQSNTSFLKWCFRLNNSYTLWIKYHIGMNNVESSVYSVIRMCSLQMLYVSLLWPCLLQTLGYLSSFFLAERKLRWPSLPLLLSPLHSATHLPRVATESLFLYWATSSPPHSQLIVIRTAGPTHSGPSTVFLFRSLLTDALSAAYIL